ncbi:TRIM2 [Branchiostoma lanceolatum]|uniref:TRIM2 protein n=1 Tax=Branchiostoma lanceolatum TaxID=7740 RepID=A0A8J9YLR8_BRALA|nr:TRIM2 [Branchiostoma lanceolatum]
MATGPVEDRGNEFDFIVCDLCDGPLDDPCVLPCWHVFCLRCLVAYSNHRYHVNIIVCPSCQQTFSLPEDGLEGLKSTSYDFLKRVAEESSAIRAQEENGYLRHYCRDREFDVPRPERLTAPVNRRCEECEDFLCNRCTCHHLRERHATGVSGTCHFHGKSREMFCETCDVEICRACVDDVHRRHDVTDIATIAQSRREDLAKTNERATKLDPEKTAEEYIDTIRQMIREQTERQLNDVAVQVARRRRLLEDQVDNMATEIRKDIKAEKAAYMLAHGGFGTSRRDTLALFEHLITCGTEREIVELYPEMIRYLAEVLPEPTPTESPANSKRSIVFTPAKDPDLSSHEFIGSLDGTWVQGHRSEFSAASPTSTSAAVLSTTTEKASSKSHHKWRDAVVKLKTKKGPKISVTDAEKHEKPADNKSNGKEKRWLSLVNKVKHHQRREQSEQEAESSEAPERYRCTARKISVDETAKQASQGHNGTKKRRNSIFSALREENEIMSPVDGLVVSSETCEVIQEGKKSSTETLASNGRKSHNEGHHMDTTNSDKSTEINCSERRKQKNKLSQFLFETSTKEKDLPVKKRRQSVSDKWLGLMSQDKKNEMEEFRRDREAARTRLRSMWAEENGAHETIAEVHAGTLEEEDERSDQEASGRSDWLKHRVPDGGDESENGDDIDSATQQNGDEPSGNSPRDQHEEMTLADRIRTALNISFLGQNNTEKTENGQDNKTADDILAPIEAQGKEVAQGDRHGNDRSMDNHARRKTSIASILSTSSNLSHVTTSSLTSSEPEDVSKGKSHLKMKKFKAILQRKRKTHGQPAEALSKELSDSDWTTDDTEARKEPNRSLGKKMKKLLKKK